MSNRMRQSPFTGARASRLSKRDTYREFAASTPVRANTPNATPPYGLFASIRSVSRHSEAPADPFAVPFAPRGFE